MGKRERVGILLSPYQVCSSGAYKLLLQTNACAMKRRQMDPDVTAALRVIQQDGPSRHIHVSKHPPTAHQIIMTDVMHILVCSINHTWLCQLLLTICCCWWEGIHGCVEPVSCLASQGFLSSSDPTLHTFLSGSQSADCTTLHCPALTGCPCCRSRRPCMPWSCMET